MRNQVLEVENRQLNDIKNKNDSFCIRLLCRILGSHSLTFISEFYGFNQGIILKILSCCVK